MPVIKRANVDKSTLLDPNASVWNQAEATTLSLQPTPVGMQPSEYITSTVKQSEVGAIGQVEVRALTNGTRLFFRLSWNDPTQNADSDEADRFADGAAILFPFLDDAPIVTMGNEGQPVNQWHWRADFSTPFNVTTAGLGTTYRTPESFVEAQAHWANERWAVVLARPLETSDPDNHVPFSADRPLKAAFCVWDGEGQERAGLKSYTPSWTEFTWEA